MVFFLKETDDIEDDIDIVVKFYRVVESISLLIKKIYQQRRLFSFITKMVEEEE